MHVTHGPTQNLQALQFPMAPPPHAHRDAVRLVHDHARQAPLCRKPVQGPHEHVAPRHLGWIAHGQVSSGWQRAHRCAMASGGWWIKEKHTCQCRCKAVHQAWAGQGVHSRVMAPHLLWCHKHQADVRTRLDAASCDKRGRAARSAAPYQGRGAAVQACQAAGW